MVKQLREKLDEMLAFQAHDAPKWISLKDARYPAREGNLADFLYACGTLENPDEDEETGAIGSGVDDGDGERS